MQLYDVPPPNLSQKEDVSAVLCHHFTRVCATTALEKNSYGLN